jgi:hypothetical protein
MMKEVEITVENRMVLEKRTLSIYHKGRNSTHLLDSSSSHTLLLKTAAEDDYLHISPGSGPGDLKNECVLRIPSWADFQFSSKDKISLSHWGKLFLLTVPAGTAPWELRMTRPNDSDVYPATDTVTISDDETL